VRPCAKKNIVDIRAIIEKHPSVDLNTITTKKIKHKL
jgi:hypothetical protein